MSTDALTHIAAAQTHYRASARHLCAVGGVTPPATEREWVLFGINQSLRNQGIGKPLPWNPPAAPEPAE